jgi:DNA polymerase I-like protein with 3'-5' exonuclease and polymerase domains
MQIEKKYYHVDSIETVNLLIEHINQSEVISYDTETTGLNVRKDQVVGWSISGDIGIGFYMPTQQWNAKAEQLEECTIGGKSAHEITKKILPMLLEKKLVMHNASFDTRITKNFYGVDLLPSLWIDTALLVHTVQEEGAGMGVFGLKPLAISIQKEIGLNVEEAANKEQVELKESIKANGGSTTKECYEIYKADMAVLSKYAAADTDLTLRVCYHFLKVLKEEGLEKFFFEEEVMPLYKEVTVPM